MYNVLITFCISLSRERLANLLNSETEKYHAEFETLFPTNEEKLNAFLTKVNDLKRRKIEERNRIANEMYEARWNKNCDELREEQRSLTLKVCARDNLETIKRRNQFRNIDNEDNKFLMNILDKKLEAEEEEREKLRLEKVLATKHSSVLNKQLATEKMQEKEEEKKKEIQEGLARLKEVQKEEALKKQVEQEERKKQLKNARKDLDKQLKLHERQVALEQEVEDIMNEKFLAEKEQFQKREEEKQVGLINCLV